MKFRVTGALKDGTPFDRVIEAPDEATVRGYASQNGASISSVDPHLSGHSLRTLESRRNAPSSDGIVVSCLVIGVLAFFFGVASAIPWESDDWALRVSYRLQSLTLFLVGMGLWLIAAIRASTISIVAAIKAQRPETADYFQKQSAL